MPWGVVVMRRQAVERVVFGVRVGEAHAAVVWPAVVRYHPENFE